MPLKLKDKIDSLNRKVVTLSSLNELQTDLIKQFQGKIENALKGSAKEQHDMLHWLNTEMKKNQGMQSEYNLMKVHFEEIHPEFYQNLMKVGDSLNDKDMRLAAFIKMRFNNLEIAFLLNLSHDGIKKAIQRLRKKLHLAPSEKLRELISDL
jgi:hypothetical protein